MATFLRSYSVLCLFCLILLTGCATQQNQATYTPPDLTPQLQSGEYVTNVDQFLILLDASSSMGDSVNRNTKLAVAKAIVQRINQTLPDIGAAGGLRTYGNTMSPFTSVTEFTHTFTDYEENPDFTAALDTISAGGKSPLDAALSEATPDLQYRSGQTAVIVVSDGQFLKDPAVEAAREMKAALGGDVCIYGVLLGRKAEGLTAMKEVVEAGQCGYLAMGENMLAPNDVAAFVTQVFLAEPLDLDGDGILNDQDLCPDTPAGEPVDDSGCSLMSGAAEPGVEIVMEPAPAPSVAVVVPPDDADADGVLNTRDDCPGTPDGVRVNDRGCWVIRHILFDFGKATIRPEYYSVLDQVAAAMMANPGLSIEIEGHTDIVGSSGFNLVLSKKRADAVADYLVRQGVSPDRLFTIGYGFTEPVAPNTTPENQAHNRRVEIEPLRVDN